MDHTDLARSDGYEHAEGRGSGLELHPSKKPSPFPKTPYMNMTFAPLERRLDTAIFRAMFASSTRQARQFVTHGDVKVNGKKVLLVLHIPSGDSTILTCLLDDISRLSTKPR